MIVNPPGKMSAAGGTTQVLRKRADRVQLFNALRNIRRDAPIRHEKYGIVYLLKDNISIDGKPAVIKIIYMNKNGVSKGKVKGERSNLHEVERLYGCGRTADSQYYYLFMPHEGLPFSNFPLSEEIAKDLMNEAIVSYERLYGLKLL